VADLVKHRIVTPYNQFRCESVMRDGNVVIGAGQAGILRAQAAEMIRRGSFQVMVGVRAVPPGGK
jgi:hypothetical protein